MASHNTQKKIALISDFTGFGRCSMTVELPIISALKVCCCPVPTSVFSNHTAFPSWYKEDFTEQLASYIAEWKKLGLTFNGISSGYLGSAAQIEIVRSFIRDFRTKDTVVIVDPVMGDNGKTYSAYTPELCGLMKGLVSVAGIVTPNLTEACILTDTPYREDFSIEELAGLAAKVAALGPSRVVITGITGTGDGNSIANGCYEKVSGFQLLSGPKIGLPRCGTGDIFAAIIAADAVNGVPLTESVEKASAFIRSCLTRSMEMDIPLTDGVCFEEVLGELM